MAPVSTAKSNARRMLLRRSHLHICRIPIHTLTFSSRSVSPVIVATARRSPGAAEAACLPCSAR
eukprot:scaffold7119_cov129-Isochrysis_galbana.AAC.3